VLLMAMPAPAQAPGVAEMYAKIRAEETDHSKIMWIIHEVAECAWGRRYGARRT